MDELSVEQKRMIERNRQMALERLAAKKRQLEKEVTPVKIQKADHQVKITKSPEQQQQPKAKERMKICLESSKTFLIYGAAHLDNLYRKYHGAVYDLKEKGWRLPLSIYDEYMKDIPEADMPSSRDSIPQNIIDLFRDLNTNSKDTEEEIDLGFLDAPLRNTLYPFQKVGIAQAIAREGRLILADDMGLGKSIQAICIAFYYRAGWPLLIVAPASMVATWHEQIKKWLSASLDPEQVCVTFDSKSKVDGLVNIISYDMAVRLGDIIKERKFKVIIADESHSFRNSEAKRTKFIVPVLKRAKRVILLSGTPALSRPVELYNQIVAVSPKLFPKFYDYGLRYCAGYQDRFGWNWKGSSNLRELQAVLEATIMIRRTKDQVLHDLPRKVRQQVFLKVEPKNLKELSVMTASADANVSGGDALESLIKRAEYMQLWKKTAEIKLPSMIKYLEDLLEGESKILLFAHHLNILDGFENSFYEKKIRFIRIDGTTPTSERQELCSQFQREEGIRVALLSITAASVGKSFQLITLGLTLTAASIVVFSELFWNPGILLQAEDRAHRIGQTDSVTVHYLLSKGTTDDRIWPLILEKLNTLEEVGLGKNDFGGMAQIEHDPTQSRIEKYFKSAGKT